MTKIKWVTFGDSVTWYDQKNFLPFTNKPNQLCVGYQSHLTEKLNWKITNQGISGDTTQDVFIRSSTFDYSTYDGVSFLVGINNFNKSTLKQFGQVQGIGTLFNTDTFCGAYQQMIEDIIQKFPHLQIILISPYRVFKQGFGELPPIYSETIKEIAEVYQLPFCDLYYDSPICPTTHPEDFVDDFKVVQYYFHLNNQGYEKISEVLVPFFKTHINASNSNPLYINNSK